MLLVVHGHTFLVDKHTQFKCDTPYQHTYTYTHTHTHTHTHTLEAICAACSMTFMQLDTGCSDAYLFSQRLNMQTPLITSRTKPCFKLKEQR